jgi:hypothetical protein
MEHQLEKLLYSRADAAAALSISIRSVDYLISEGKLSTRRIGRKTLIPVGEVRRFARSDHPDRIRTNGKVQEDESGLTVHQRILHQVAEGFASRISIWRRDNTWALASPMAPDAMATSGRTRIRLI